MGSVVPNSSVPSKNEMSNFRRGQLLVHAFVNYQGEHNLLCPVKNLKNFLHTSGKINLSAILVNPRTMAPCSKVRISQMIRRVVKLSQPEIFKGHDLWNTLRCKPFLMTCLWQTSRRLDSGGQIGWSRRNTCSLVQTSTARCRIGEGSTGLGSCGMEGSLLDNINW